MNAIQTAMTLVFVAATTSAMATAPVEATPAAKVDAGNAHVKADTVQTTTVAKDHAKATTTAVANKATEVKDATAQKIVAAKDATLTQTTEVKETVAAETEEVKQAATEQTVQAEEKVEAVKTEEKKSFFSWFKKKAA